MIFATVGTQLPFPRLIDALDALAPRLAVPVVAQIGTAEGSWPSLDLRATLTPAEFEALFTSAQVIVAHAGIGTILSARRWHKPLVILPRRHALGEHRNDHQLATARQVSGLPGIYVAWETEDLGQLLTRTDLAPASDASSHALDGLVNRLRQVISA